MTTVGMVGLGTMGARMARRLLAAGFEVVAFDAVPAAVDALVTDGAVGVRSPRQVADAAQVVLVSLPSPDVSREVALGEDGLVHGERIKVYVDLSTTGAPVAREIAGSLAKNGIGSVDAPVSGGPGGAEGGTLTLMVAGKPEHVEVARPFLEPLSGKIFTVGTEPGQGQAVKVINNLLMAGTLALTGEAVTLGVKAGLDPAVLLDVIHVSTGQNNAASTKFPKQVLTRKFDHGFRLSLLLKDLRLGLDQARELGVPMPLGAAVEQTVELATAMSAEAADCTEVVRMIESWSDVEIGAGSSKPGSDS
jgi:3-hydroxyisobutyrate dehydrogenase-like beta-hydroxyacid dehydrogenase